MKYIVGLKYTNPAHEHVSLRRRVESRNAVVEAASEEEAILRASRQQRALGFMVQDAGIVQPQINESVESVDEAKGEPPPEFMPSDTKLPRIKVPPKPKGRKYYMPVKPVLKGSVGPAIREEEVDADKRDAGYKMSPAVRKAQSKFDAETRAQKSKNVQAGTLAAAKQRARKTDEASDPGKTRVVNKKVKTEKAAETMVAKAKGIRNKINMQPSLDTNDPKKV